MSDASTSAAPVTELKASAHLMRLDPGVFCIFNTPGTGTPDAQTGLPGVRISPAPAASGFDGEVGLSGLDLHGWLGADGAALVRVRGGPAQVLVTVYQSQDGGQEPPKLQVLRLTGAAPAASAPARAQAAPGPAPMEVAAHIYGRGDVAGRLGEWMGERGSKRWIEGFGLQPASDVPVADLEYQAVLGRGWLSPWAEGGQYCGSRGMSLPILGLRVRLRGASAATHAVTVSASFVDGTLVGPVDSDQTCEAPSLAALEAFLVTIAPKQAPKQTSAPARSSRREPKPATPTAPIPAPSKPQAASKPALKRAAPAPKPAAKPGRKR